MAGAQKVNTALTDLNVKLNSIGDSGAAAFAEALKVNTALTELAVLWGNNIQYCTGESGRTAWVSIGESLARNSQLSPPPPPPWSLLPCTGHGTLQPQCSCICNAPWAGYACELENVTEMQILVFESAHKQAHVAARAAGCLQTLVQDDVDIDGSGGAGESESASGSVYYVHDGLDSVDEDAIKQLQLLDSEMCKTLNNAVAMAAAAFAGARETRSKFEAYEILIASLAIRWHVLALLGQLSGQGAKCLLTELLQSLLPFVPSNSFFNNVVGCCDIMLNLI